ncbi:hypothetical protein ILYODFUR_036522 [Ilyodon furcidens]|uniref:Uncharacterized protein n=1 Tax=Ilyodon furcidens TaxID=33524 RepID=A0ABV0TU06_9TELE
MWTQLQETATLSLFVLYSYNTQEKRPQSPSFSLQHQTHLNVCPDAKPFSTSPSLKPFTICPDTNLHTVFPGAKPYTARQGLKTFTVYQDPNSFKTYLLHKVRGSTAFKAKQHTPLCRKPGLSSSHML